MKRPINRTISPASSSRTGSLRDPRSDRGIRPFLHLCGVGSARTSAHFTASRSYKNPADSAARVQVPGRSRGRKHGQTRVGSPASERPLIDAVASIRFGSHPLQWPDHVQIVLQDPGGLTMIVTAGRTGHPALQIEGSAQTALLEARLETAGKHTQPAYRTLVPEEAKEAEGKETPTGQVSQCVVEIRDRQRKAYRLSLDLSDEAKCGIDHGT